MGRELRSNFRRTRDATRSTSSAEERRECDRPDRTARTISRSGDGAAPRVGGASGLDARADRRVADRGRLTVAALRALVRAGAVAAAQVGSAVADRPVLRGRSRVVGAACGALHARLRRLIALEVDRAIGVDRAARTARARRAAAHVGNAGRRCWGVARAMSVAESMRLNEPCAGAAVGATRRGAAVREAATARARAAVARGLAQRGRRVVTKT